MQSAIAANFHVPEKRLARQIAAPRFKIVVRQQTNISTALGFLLLQRRNVTDKKKTATPEGAAVF